jgi:hypothetical protein
MLPNIVQFFLTLDKTSRNRPLGKDMYVGRNPHLSILNTVMGYYVDQLLFWELAGFEEELVYAKTREFQ